MTSHSYVSFCGSNMLCSRQADVDGRVPLHFAACFGHRPVVETLLGAGANVRANDNEGFTALHYASRWDRPEVVEYLVWLEGEMLTNSYP
eukprot:SAG31_NODE_730_length_12505_cov_3.807109_5_plen_90_part_00